MLKVLVVDDEKIVRIALSTIIKWQENGFELIGAAADGLQALTAIEKNRPDIVITDLKMPNMDGLELIRKLSEIKFPGKIIVLSNFNDFDLVRESMKLGAMDYLLKVTLKPNELLPVLIKASEMLTEDRVRQVNSDQIQIELNEKQRLERNRLWIDLLQEDERHISDVLLEADRMGLSPVTITGRLLLLKIHQLEHVLSKGKIKNKKLLHFSISNIIKEVFSERYTTEFVELRDGEFVVIVHQQGQQDDEHALSLISNKLIQLISLYLNLSINVALSGRFAGYDQLRQQFLQCCRSIQTAFYADSSSVIVAASMGLTSSMSPNPYPGWSEKLKALVEEGDVQQLEETLKVIWASIKQVLWDPSVLKRSFMLLLLDLDQLSYKLGASLGKAAGAPIPSPSSHSERSIERIMKAETFEHFCELTEQALIEICISLQELKSKSCRKEVLRVLEILRERLDDRLTLDMLASAVNMNVSYLCRVFKQDTGKSIVQYMNEQKVNHAVELLKQPDVRIKEVSATVGIQDPFYFNRLFKKMVGVSPSDFRRKYRAKGD